MVASSGGDFAACLRMAGNEIEAAAARRLAIVTGATRGIGAATARALAGAGMRLVIAARSAPALTELASELGDAVAVPTDLRDPAAIERLVETGERLGGVDVIVHAAGLGVFAPIAEATLADWDETIEVNLRGAFVLCRAALPAMRARQRGHIVTIVSIAGVRAFPGAAAYCASKFGLLGLTRSIAEEVRREGIKVTAIVPGAVDTPFWERSGGDFARERMLRPEAVAEAIRFAVTAPPGVHHDEITLMPPDGVL